MGAIPLYYPQLSGPLSGHHFVPVRLSPGSGNGRDRLNRETVVIKLDIINEVVTKTGITKTKAELAVETVFDSMKKALATGDRIELRGFGVFNVRPRKTGIGRNPRTGAEVNIPPGKAVRFKPGKELQSIE
jgi:DNA-binding protein HU-beta